MFSKEELLMNNSLIVIYTVVIFIINLLHINKINTLNNNTLFDYLSTNIIFITCLILYTRYHSIRLCLLLIFIEIFINYIYIKDVKDVKEKKYKILLFLLFLYNLFVFIHGSIKYLFIK